MACFFFIAFISIKIIYIKYHLSFLVIKKKNFVWEIEVRMIDILIFIPNNVRKIIVEFFFFFFFFSLFCIFIRNTRRAICWSSMKNKGRYERYSCIHFAPITSTALEIIAFLTPRAPCIRSVRRLGTFASDNIAVLVAASCNETATYSDGGRCLTG